MPYQLQPGEDEAVAAHKMLGDARMVHEIAVVNGVAYLRDEHPGKPAQWAADPKNLRSGKDESWPESQ